MALHKLALLGVVSIVSIQLFFPAYAVVTVGGVVGAAASMVCAGLAMTAMCAPGAAVGLYLAPLLEPKCSQR